MAMSIYPDRAVSSREVRLNGSGVEYECPCSVTREGPTIGQCLGRTTGNASAICDPHQVQGKDVQSDL